MQMISVMPLVGNNGIGFQPIDKFVRMGDVVFLARAANQPDRIAESIARRMDFGAQASA
jgi:hypothetical protein